MGKALRGTLSFDPATCEEGVLTTNLYAVEVVVGSVTIKWTASGYIDDPRHTPDAWRALARSEAASMEFREGGQCHALGGGLVWVDPAHAGAQATIVRQGKRVAFAMYDCRGAIEFTVPAIAVASIFETFARMIENRIAAFDATPTPDLF